LILLSVTKISITAFSQEPNCDNSFNSDDLFTFTFDPKIVSAITYFYSIMESHRGWNLKNSALTVL
jgi:hypothetical protein